MAVNDDYSGDGMASSSANALVWPWGSPTLGYRCWLPCRIAFFELQARCGLSPAYQNEGENITLCLTLIAAWRLTSK